MKFRAAAPRFATGYPATDRVTAKRLRAAGDILRRTGPVVLVNGTNAFTVDVAPYKKVSLAPAGEGVYSIVGHATLDDAPAVTLAKFGSESTAQNAHAALLKAHAGVNTGGGKRSIVKLGGGLLALFCVVVVLSAITAAPMQPSLAATGVSPVVPQQYAQEQAAAPSGGSYNRNEPTLEDLANGKYQFSPKLKAPTVEVPTLNCAKH